MSSGARRGTGTAALMNASSPVPRIRPLNAEAISQIHSSKFVTSLTNATLSLLENSLDAGATRIEITADWRRGGCTVDDNGIGISVAEFRPDGGLGKMYSTSKHLTSEGQHALPVHGSTGTFLAELAAMSLLTIKSIHREEGSSASLTLHLGKVIARDTAASEVSEFSPIHMRHGTSVSVRDLFGSMPVRVKQRALAAGAGLEEGKEWRELKRGITSLVLAWPRPCAVKLVDADTPSRAITVAANHPNVARALTEKSLNDLAGKHTRFDIRDLLSVLFQTGFASPETRSKWIPLSADTSDARLKGMICLEPAPTKQCQFISLGITPCGHAGRHNELYDAVNKVFANSSFGKLEATTSEQSSKHKRRKMTCRAEQLKSQKGLDRQAMYFVQLDLCHSSRQHYSGAEHLKDAAIHSLVEILEAAVAAWLESHHFHPRRRRRRRDAEHHAPTAVDFATSHSNPTSRGRSIAPPRPAGFLAHDSDSINLPPQRGRSVHHQNSSIKFGRPGRHSHASERTRSPHALKFGCQTDGDSANPNIIRAPTIEERQYSRTSERLESLPQSLEDAVLRRTTERSDDFGSSIPDEELVAAAESVLVDDRHNAAGGGDGVVTWTDPVTKQIFRVNSRTGIVFPFPGEEQPRFTAPASSVISQQRAGIDMALSSAGKPISLARRNALAKDRPSSATSLIDRHAWLPGFLKEWNNPVFVQRQEHPIPVASVGGPTLLETNEASKCFGHHSIRREAFGAHGSSWDSGNRISKTALQQARVIAQVDQKFLLVKLPGEENAAQPGLADEGDALVLIDQHAASERIILETLLADLCSITSAGISGQSNTAAIRSTQLVAIGRNKSLGFEVSTQEQKLFAQYKAYFAAWGIHYDLQTSASTAQQSSTPSTARRALHRLTITALPSPIVERCANTPSLTIELLRHEIWDIADGNKKAIPPKLSHNTTESDTPTWLNLLPSMPTHMLQMLHSRACRSAIMFNDPLTTSECQTLVDQLKACTFPFVCAHGRVSMVPIVDFRRLGPGNGTGGFDVGMRVFRRHEEKDEDASTRNEEEGAVSIAALQEFMREEGRK